MPSRDEASVVVRFELQGEPETPESNVVVEVMVPRPITLNSLNAAFPYEGRFHFRQRVTIKGQRTHCWLDLTESATSSDLQPPAGKRLDIRALPLWFGEQPSNKDGVLNLDWGDDDQVSIIFSILKDLRATFVDIRCGGICLARSKLLLAGNLDIKTNEQDD